MEALEGAATLSPVLEWQAETAGAKPPPPGALEGTASARNCCCSLREVHPYKVFCALVIARVATRSLTAPGDRPCSGSVPTPVATRWNGFWGENGAALAADPEWRGKWPGLSGDKRPLISSGHIRLGLWESVSSACAQGEEGSKVLSVPSATCSACSQEEEGERGRSRRRVVLSSSSIRV